MARLHITEGVSGDGTFLDVGCANGLLMESVTRWCAERGLRIEPYGLDLAPGLVALARQRLPQWAGRIWAGNAIDWFRRAASVSTACTCCSTAFRRAAVAT
jgi:2-polyprenyl-3-methyl-5-hydroxy-6-metoxy-1,4-benzoquinol methylase